MIGNCQILADSITPSGRITTFEIKAPRLFLYEYKSKHKESIVTLSNIAKVDTEWLISDILTQNYVPDNQDKDNWISGRNKVIASVRSQINGMSRTILNCQLEPYAVTSAVITCKNLNLDLIASVLHRMNIYKQSMAICALTKIGRAHV